MFSEDVDDETNARLEIPSISHRQGCSRLGLHPFILGTPYLPGVL